MPPVLPRSDLTRPARSSTVIFDTGSSDLVLTRSNCTNCAGQRKYDSSKSSSFSVQPAIQEVIPFGTGANAVPLGEPQNASGIVVTDTVTIGGRTVPKQAFLLQDTVAVAFNQMPIDGVLGMPPFSRSNLVAPGDNSVKPAFWELSAAGQLPNPVFSFLFNSGRSEDGQGGELLLGGIDESKHDGPITYVGLNETVTRIFGEWLVMTPEVSVNGKAILQDPLSISLLDTGTAYILAPDEATARKLYAAVSPDIRQIDPNGAWGAPCDVMQKLQPNLTFVVSDDKGAKFTLHIDTKSFNVGEYPGQKGTCQAVVLHPVPPVNVGVPFWTIGSPALKSYYTIWDGNNMKIGFANPKRASGGDEDNDGNGPFDAPDDAGTLQRPALLAVLFIAGVSALFPLF